MKRKTSNASHRQPRPTDALGPVEGTALIPPVALPPDWEHPPGDSPRGRIHRAARQLFAEKGLDATSIRDITAAADVNSAMVHYYFGSKEELYRRVLGLEILSVFRTIHQQMRSDVTEGELLISLPGRIARVVRANRVWANLFRQEMGMGAPYLEKVVRELKESGPLGVKAQFETLYRAAVKRKDLRSLPADNVIQYLVILGYSGIFFEPFFRIVSGVDPDDDAAFEERIKVFDTLIRHGLVPEKKPSHKL